MFARGGMRTVVTALAWAAVAFVLVAFAQSALGHEPGLRLLAPARRGRAAVRAVHQSQSRRHLEPARPVPVFRLPTVAPRGRLPFPCVELAGAGRSRPRRPQPGARPGDAAADRERGCGRIAIGDAGLACAALYVASPHPAGRLPDARRCGPARSRSRDARRDRLCRSGSPAVARRRDPPARARHSASPSGATHSRSSATSP